mmetsp:Transcript_30178/g.80002  ORF Transcript_30178/g.80002 Transcript_30178/m.80002 type:complete len:112 (+) Transcript_30178:428-763(+)
MTTLPSKSRSALPRASAVCRSRWFVGSSRTRTWGGRSMTRASATRLRSPPDRQRRGCVHRRPRPKLPRWARTSASWQPGWLSQRASRAVASPGRLSAWCWSKKPTTTRGCW